MVEKLKDRLFFPIVFKDNRFFDPQNILEYDRWYEWIDKYGNIEKGRAVFDVCDHFYPETKELKEENIIGFRFIKKDKKEYKRKYKQPDDEFKKELFDCLANEYEKLKIELIWRGVKNDK